ncbi:anti-sigma factor [Catenovulum sp. SM1970]|uniref:anti-sigma factor n=1 Tax=Marinifaba aquimaris TaxID=2741323 RepID=UPI001571A485|nr:anti-sigma factor [Marinifaba aquimaris]NTS77222.1 anti-sigma factor [Marinifaba aquimaris]
MPNSINRYSHPAIVEHLASNYVLGTLTPHVSKRVDTLRKQVDVLEENIHFWQNRLIGLNQQTQAIEPKPQTWQNSSEQLGFEAPKLAIWKRLYQQFSQAKLAYAFAFSMLFIGMLYYPQLTTQPTSLSYVAVLTDEQEQAHVVASTYGENLQLILNIVNQPELDTDQTMELWAISKSDQQARSLSVIPQQGQLHQILLTQAQWRLIKDSHSLVITIEDEGGSAIGEPSEDVLSKGLCVRLQDWQQPS